MKRSFILVSGIVLSFVLFSYVIQESESTVCYDIQTQFYWDDTIVFLGTRISSEKIFYDEPIQTFDGLLHFYTLHEFMVDEILKGHIENKSITVKASQFVDSLPKEPHIVIVSNSDKQYHTVGCGSIYGPTDHPKSQMYFTKNLELVKIMSAMENQKYSEDAFLEFLHVQTMKTVHSENFATIIIGKINEYINPSFIFATVKTNATNESFYHEHLQHRNIPIYDNEFFGFQILHDRPNFYMEHELKIGIIDEGEPVIKTTSFDVDYTTSPPKNTSDMQTCENNFVPILKNTNLSLNCVKSTTQKKLIERDWGTGSSIEQILYPHAFRENTSEPLPEPPPEPSKVLVHSSDLYNIT